MAVIQGKSGGGLSGMLGGLAMIGGALTGQPWLSVVGTGLGMMNGGGSGGEGQSSMGKILDGIVCGDWFNPGEGSLAKPNAGLDMQSIIRKILGW